MKAIRRFAQVQVLLLSLLSSTVVPMAVHADEVRGAFTLASETHWGKLVLPAGYYTYSLATNTAMPVILIRSANGNLAGFVPVVVMDVWEHAFIKDYKPSDKGKYIEAFFANVDWKACESRLP